LIRMAKTELQLESELSCCMVSEKDKVAAILKSSDVLLVTPGAYECVKKLAPSRVAVFNVIDRVDPISLRLVKDRILGANDHTHLVYMAAQ
jgi:hypothetical protein